MTLHCNNVSQSFFCQAFFSPQRLHLILNTLSLLSLNSPFLEIYYNTQIMVYHFSQQNTELIERLQECIRKSDVGVLDSNNNTSNTEEQPQLSTSLPTVDEHKEQGNKTYEIVDSQIPKDLRVHVSSNDLGTHEVNDSALPDSSTEVKVQEQTGSETELSSRRVLKELNQEDSPSQY